MFLNGKRSSSSKSTGVHNYNIWKNLAERSGNGRNNFIKFTFFKNVIILQTFHPFLWFKNRKCFTQRLENKVISEINLLCDETVRQYIAFSEFCNLFPCRVPHKRYVVVSNPMYTFCKKFSVSKYSKLCKGY